MGGSVCCILRCAVAAPGSPTLPTSGATPLLPHTVPTHTHQSWHKNTEPSAFTSGYFGAHERISPPKMPSNPRVRKRDGQKRAKPLLLTYRQRIEILTLRNYAGWSYTQISNILTIPRSTVRRVISLPETPKKPQEVSTSTRLQDGSTSSGSQDDSTVHTAKATQALLDQQGILGVQMVCPANSPDLNPIEDDDMRERCQAVIDADGDTTPSCYIYYGLRNTDPYLEQVRALIRRIYQKKEIQEPSFSTYHLDLLKVFRKTPIARINIVQVVSRVKSLRSTYIAKRTYSRSLGLLDNDELYLYTPSFMHYASSFFIFLHLAPLSFLLAIYLLTTPPLSSPSFPLPSSSPLLPNSSIYPSIYPSLYSTQSPTVACTSILHRPWAMGKGTMGIRTRKKKERERERLVRNKANAILGYGWYGVWRLEAELGREKGGERGGGVAISIVNLNPKKKTPLPLPFPSLLSLLPIPAALLLLLHTPQQRLKSIQLLPRLLYSDSDADADLCRGLKLSVGGACSAPEEAEKELRLRLRLRAAEKGDKSQKFAGAGKGEENKQQVKCCRVEEWGYMSKSQNSSPDKYHVRSKAIKTLYDSPPASLTLLAIFSKCTNPKPIVVAGGYLPSSLVLGLCRRLFICVLRYVSSFRVSRLRAGLGVVPLLPLLLLGELGRDVAIS
ncbi:hypothetical protein GMOD_00009942 [Pyrenophora seminiperda CCB06]|uniref:Uncharacterized protein n=1 Tax=Pyrenophora seminiperda CCB06 TaxID=1302712 RepID=A0A3M7M1R2_9PLEO|nr:hypothetical protein GMOD_00009942 [Pyrenophora seminiperda CCB06]